MLKKQTYENGQRVYDLQGTTLTYYYENGVMRATGAYENGQMEGEWRFYRENGQLCEVGMFLNGQKNGPWRGYDENGELSCLEAFVNDIKKCG